MNPLDTNPLVDPTVAHFQEQELHGDADPYRDFFRAVITARTLVSGVWNYSWKEQTLVTTTGGHTDANPRRSGDTTSSPAIEMNNLAVAVGTYVFMRQKGIVKGQVYYEFEYPGSAPSCGSGSGSGSGCGNFGPDGVPDSQVVGGQDGCDPIAVRDVLCIRGKKYVTRGRLQIIQCRGRLRNDWYQLATTKEGCCSCESGSGSGGADPPAPPSGCGSGSGPGTLCGCTGNQVTPLAAVISGPFGVDGATVELAGNLAQDSSSWGGSATGSGVTADVELVCVGGAWELRFAVVTDDCDLLAVAVPLAASACDTLEGTQTLSGRAADGTVSVSIDHPCPDCSGPIPIDLSAPGECGTTPSAPPGSTYSTSVPASADYSWAFIGDMMPFGPIAPDVPYSVRITGNTGTLAVRVLGECSSLFIYAETESSAATFCLDFVVPSGAGASLEIGFQSDAGATFEFQVVQAACP